MKLHLACIAAACALLAPAPVDACSCMGPWTDLLAPEDGATGVPTNTRIWVGSGTRELWWAMVLQDPDGRAVDWTLSTLYGGGDSVTVYTPVEPLEPAGTYTLVHQGYEEDVVLSTFQVWTGPDDEPPPIPEEVGRSGRSSGLENLGSSCGPSSSVTVTVDGAGPVVLGDVGTREEPDLEALEGRSDELSVNGQLYFGKGPCSSTWRNATPSATTRVRWGAFDLAGNFSGWSEDVLITTPPAGCSCTSAGPPPTAGAWFLLAAAAGALGLRRR